MFQFLSPWGFFERVSLTPSQISGVQFRKKWSPILSVKNTFSKEDMGVYMIDLYREIYKPVLILDLRHLVINSGSLMVGGLNRLLTKEIRSRQWKISEESRSRQTGLKTSSIPSIRLSKLRALT
jgi:hypothetical protein